MISCFRACATHRNGYIESCCHRKPRGMVHNAHKLLCFAVHVTICTIQAKAITQETFTTGGSKVCDETKYHAHAHTHTVLSSGTPL